MVVCSKLGQAETFFLALTTSTFFLTNHAQNMCSVKEKIEGSSSSLNSPEIDIIGVPGVTSLSNLVNNEDLATEGVT